jgi:hypothetical protein
MPYFVFVEFGSEPVRDFLRKLRSALNPEPKSSPIHVTLRGPYSEPPPIEELQGYAERLRGYGVKIHNQGYFSTPAGYSVFLRAECSIFRELWDKPDFKVPLSLIQPHITVYESPDRTRAMTVRDFLRRERIHIHTYDLFLRVYESRSPQLDMFGIPPVFASGRRVSEDVWRTSDEVLDRAKALGVTLAEKI